MLCLNGITNALLSKEKVVFVEDKKRAPVKTKIAKSPVVKETLVVPPVNGSEQASQISDVIVAPESLTNIKSE